MVVVKQPHSPNGRSEFKCCARPNRLWGRPKGPLGGPGAHLSSPILPRFRPERRKSLFWPLGAGAPPVGQKKVPKRWLSPTSDGDGRGHGRTLTITLPCHVAPVGSDLIGANEQGPLIKGIGGIAYFEVTRPNGERATAMQMPDGEVVGLPANAQGMTCLLYTSPSPRD